MYQARGCMGKQRKYRPSPGTHFLLAHHTSFALHHTNIQALCFHAGLTITEVNKRRFCFFFSSLSSPPTLLCSANWLWTEALQVIRMLSARCWEREVPETAGPAASWKPLGLRQNPHLILFSLQPLLSLSFAPVEVLLGSLLSLEFSSLVLLQLWLAFICVCSFFFLSCFII